MPKRETLLKTIIGGVIAIATLWLTFRNTDWSELQAVVSSASMLPLLLVLPLLTASYTFRVLRWRVLLIHLEAVPYRILTPPVLVAFMLNSVFPGRIGEVARAMLLARKTRVPFSSGFATVVVARLFDGLSLTLLALLVMVSMWRDLTGAIRSGLMLAGAGYIAVLLVLAALRAWHGKAAALLVRPLRMLGLNGPAGKLEGMLLSFAAGLDVLKSPRDIVKAAAFSAGVWGCLTASVIPVFWSLGMSFQWYTAPLVLVLSGLGMLIPTPAGTGTIHYLLGVVFPVITGVPEPTAKAMAILFHASQFLPIIVAGLIAQGDGLRKISLPP
ncbi:MAG: lysylphosphatidylglycerol synthase transmembrane domain-containing protein [Candidatus Fermentibacteraceae bacterium]